MIDIINLQKEIRVGIEHIKVEYGKEINASKKPLTNYQLEKLAGLTGKTIDTVQASGGITMKTLCKIGAGLGYEGSELCIAMSVLYDMNQDELSPKQLSLRSNRIIKHQATTHRVVRTQEEIRIDREAQEAKEAINTEQEVLKDMAGK